jgi:hypothetical protein
MSRYPRVVWSVGLAAYVFLAVLVGLFAYSLSVSIDRASQRHQCVSVPSTERHALCYYIGERQ